MGLVLGGLAAGFFAPTPIPAAHPKTSLVIAEVGAVVLAILGAAGGVAYVRLTTRQPTDGPDLRYSLTDAGGEEAYPVAGTAWAVLYADLTDRAAGKELVEFLRWATHEGQAYVTELQFAPLPPGLVKRIEDRLGRVRVK